MPTEIKRTPLEEVHSRLEFNVAAYGKAWTGENEDTKFIVRPLLDEVERLREAISIALPALEGYLQGESGLPFTDPYRACRTAAEALRAVRPREETT